MFQCRGTDVASAAIYIALFWLVEIRTTSEVLSDVPPIQVQQYGKRKVLYREVCLDDRCEHFFLAKYIMRLRLHSTARVYTLFSCGGVRDRWPQESAVCLEFNISTVLRNKQVRNSHSFAILIS